MERKKSKSKGIRRLASVKNKTKTSVFDVIDLPIPSYEVEDALQHFLWGFCLRILHQDGPPQQGDCLVPLKNIVKCLSQGHNDALPVQDEMSQIQVTDVLQNCVLGENPSSWSISDEFGGSTTQKRKQSLVYHRCYNDTTFIPLWHAFSIMDIRSVGQALLGRLMSVAKTLTPVLGEDHTDTAVQKQFLNYSQVPFSQYQRFILDSTSRRNIDADKLSALCWGHCKNHYLSNPIVDGLDSVLPPEMCESLYYLFCIFNKLTEPGTYPPTMDHEEAELLLRKLFACLGMPWSSYDEPHEPPIIEEGEKEVEEEHNSPLQISFGQLLSIISDMIGTEMARSSLFHRAVQRLCLIEYQEVIKAGWLSVRKEDNESWKKRWGVLRRNKLIFYDTVLCQLVKEEVELHGNMHVESLPGTSSHKHRFRVVEKEGFNIIKEMEFSTTTANSAHSWITQLNVSVKIQETGMSAKMAEICERRLERFKRRESLREVQKKKKDLQDTYRRLEEARKVRTDIMDRLSERSRHRQSQLDHLEKINKVYEKLEAIQFQIRLLSKEEREERMMKLLNKYEECVKKGKVIDDSLWKENEDSKALKELNLEKSQLESELEGLKQTAALLSSNMASVHLHPPKRSGSLEHNSYTSSENLSTTSNDVTHCTVQEVTI